MLGIAVGGIALVITFLILRRLTFMIPIGAIFSVTSVLLYAMAVVFAGQGIQSFQESGVLGATFVNHIPTAPMLGLYPTVETLAAQALLILLAAAAVLFPKRRARTQSRRAEQRHPHTQATLS
jgi:high-affinity iron transporter